MRPWRSFIKNYIYETHQDASARGVPIIKVAEIIRKVHFCRLPTTTHSTEQLSHPLAARWVVKHLYGAVIRSAARARANITVHRNCAAVDELRICSSCTPAGCQTSDHHPYKRAEFDHSFSLATYPTSLHPSSQASATLLLLLLLLVQDGLLCDERVPFSSGAFTSSPPPIRGRRHAVDAKKTAKKQS